MDRFLLNGTARRYILLAGINRHEKEVPIKLNIVYRITEKYSFDSPLK